MRMLLIVKSDTAAANRAMEDGSWDRMMQDLMPRLQPEAAYAAAIGGGRGGVFVFDLKDPADIPSIAEPLFRTMNASIELVPAMTMDEVQAGVAAAAA